MSQGEPTVRPPEDATVAIKITTPNFLRKIEKTFNFALHETVWQAKQKVLVEFVNMEIKDPLNFGFYLPPNSGRAGKFLDESRLLQDYPMDGVHSHLEFRYKRRIFRHLHPQEEKKLLKVNTKKHRRKFMELVNGRHVDDMERLLEKGLDPNFHDEKSGETPLMVAAMMDECEKILKLLVMYGAYLDFRSQSGLTALHGVAIMGKIDCMKVLLNLGASPDCRDTKGLTPLYHSIIAGSSPNIAQLLLLERAETGVCDSHGLQEIHQVCKLGQSQQLEHLIYYRANVDALTPSGRTALHIAALENQEVCVRVLCFRGADRTIKNLTQQTAYEVAIIANHFDVAAIINDFKETDIKRFVDLPEYSKRRSKALLPQVSAKPPQLSVVVESETPNHLPSEPSTPATSLLHASSTPDDMNKLGVRQYSTHSLPEVLDEYSGSESDSEDDEEELKPMSKRRGFSNAGVGTLRSPAPIKVKTTEPVVLRKRLYASVPGRHFVAVTDYEPKGTSEVALTKGDVVEVLYVGENGFWEGKVRNKAGWFPSFCVQEMKKQRNNSIEKKRTWFGSKRSVESVAEKQAKKQEPRDVTLKRNDKGFGFQMRGANSHAPHIEFTPSPQFPALQYIGEVDKGGVAEKAELLAGDFVLAINGEDVASATHSYAVSLINKGGKVLKIRVMTVIPNEDTMSHSSSNESLKNKDANALKAAGVGGTDTFRKKPPPPPMRSNSTSLSQRDDTSILSEAAVAMQAETVVLEKGGNNHRNSTKGMWSGYAYKLHGEDVKVREEDISRGISRKQKAMSCDFASDFDAKFSKITKQVTVDTSLYPPVDYKPPISAPKVSPKNLAVNDKEKLSRQTTPPGYEHTIENMRKGRTNSLSKGDRPQSVAIPTNEVLTRKNSNNNLVPNNRQYDNKMNTLPSNYNSPSHYMNSEQINNRPLSALQVRPPNETYAQRSVTMDQATSQSIRNNMERVPPQTLLAAHQNMLYRDYDQQDTRSSPDGLIRQTKALNFEVNQNPQTDGLVRSLQQRMSPTGDVKLISPKSTPTESPSPVSSAMPPPPPPPVIGGAPPPPPPPPPPVASSNFGFANSIANAAALRSTQVTEEKKQDNFDKDLESPPGSAGLGLYNSSSSVSLDSAGSKDSGYENCENDHSNALQQAIAARAAKMASANTSVVTSLPSTKEVPEEKSTIEEIKLVRPSDLKKNKQNDLNPTEVDNGYSSPTMPRQRTVSKEKVPIPPPVTSKPKVEPPAVASKPKPSPPKLKQKPAKSTDENNNNPNKKLCEDLATLYLDGVIADAEASIDYDLISIASSTASVEEEKKVDVDLPPPPMELLNDEKNGKSPTLLPPPPQKEVVKKTLSVSLSTSELPPSLSEKEFMMWTTSDVADWLDFLKLSQYKDAFLENDIEGKHLSDLSKDELRELGVVKLGHRKTLDEAIKKLCGG